MQHHTIQYHTIQYNSIQYNAMQYNAIHDNPIQRHKIFTAFSFFLPFYTELSAAELRVLLDKANAEIERLKEVVSGSEAGQQMIKLTEKVCRSVFFLLLLLLTGNKANAEIERLKEVVSGSEAAQQMIKLTEKVCRSVFFVLFFFLSAAVDWV